VTIDRRTAAVLAAAVIVGLAGMRPAVVSGASFEAVEEADSRIERPMVDVHLLAPEPGERAPRLLVIDAERAAAGAIRMALLVRDRSWSEVASLDVGLRPAAGGIRPEWGLDTPWMVPLDDRSVAVIANAPGEGAAYVARVSVAAGSETGRELDGGRWARIPFEVDDAGLADPDGDGQPSLLLASARTERGGATCQGTTILVTDPVTFATEATVVLPDRRIAAGVVGAFDAVRGDELVAYAYPNCPAGPDTAVEARLVAIALRDGSVVFEQRAAVATGFLGAPVRVELPDGRQAVVARVAAGLALLVPGEPWMEVPLTDGAAWPLAAVPSLDGGDDAVFAWMDLEPGARTVVVGTMRDAPSATGTIEPVVIDAQRWEHVIASVEESGRTGAPPVALLADVGGSGCPDLFLPGALLACGETTPRTGAAWTATRPLHVFGEGSSRRLLVAAGIGWDEGRPPRTPAPAASGVSGWWRHGPSAPFVLAEARAADATYFRDFPVPLATVERVAGPQGTVDLPGFTGTRLFVRVREAPEEATEASVPSRDEILRAPSAPAERLVVARVDVPPAVETGRDGGFARVDLGPSRSGEGPWLVTVVPINDWGELGRPGAGIVARDVRAPLLEFEAPFTTPIWPETAELTGVAEPRTTVLVDGEGPLELDRRGRFVIRETLTPWPRTFRLTATDASGNVTAMDVTVVGGIDYRQLPLEAMLATVLLIAAIVSGIFGSRRRAGATPRMDDGLAQRRWVDDGPGPEIEDLPSSGGGFGRR
jgi:hypothetical protein